MEKIALKDAKAAGLKRYFTGIPCKNGHIAERSVSSRACLKCANARMKLFFEANKDLVRARKAEAQKKYRKNCSQKARESRQSWAKKNRAKDQNYKKKWRTENKGAVNNLTRKRQTAKLQRTPAWLTEDDFWMIQEAYALAALRTKLFGFSWHVDHIFPLQGKVVSGLHVPINLQVIPGKENVRKGNRMINHAH
jgi:hypothetical protein